MEENTINHDRNHAELRRIGLDLKAMRVAANLSVDQLVEMAEGELKRGTVLAIERGSYNAGVRQLMIYARLMGCKIQFVADERITKSLLDD